MKTNFRMSSEDAAFMLQNENDIIECEEKRQLRIHDLRRAAILGSVYDTECRIEFEDQYGEVSNEVLTVIGVTDKNVIAKNHKLIPIHRISRVVV